ncbi:hypothetical protein AB840_15060 [Megasphaera cerevisiae DSM 20462]|uniref:Phage protein n=1 Tax=Megasphaera cerevisiae DSM 20462 TaxID=1122219 RepID=A0A0J6WTU4_9FIRM|nr:hypothetical protein [Megasphaera cerevisiae]KMO85182.1 hypothetical protein AB840_15060 [Megasphaera cerevisiae DSM 20462]SKA27945.1 hypothetical protein SAMN05660900_03159 [Megasphaera cerevisiae DSM 20462]
MDEDKKYKLLKIIEQFESDYKHTLLQDETKIDKVTFELFYNLGADVKHALENIVHEISK